MSTGRQLDYAIVEALRAVTPNSSAAQSNLAHAHYEIEAHHRALEKAARAESEFRQSSLEENRLLRESNEAVHRKMSHLLETESRSMSVVADKLDVLIELLTPPPPPPEPTPAEVAEVLGKPTKKMITEDADYWSRFSSGHE